MGQAISGCIQAWPRAMAGFTCPRASLDPMSTRYPLRSTPAALRQAVIDQAATAQRLAALCPIETELVSLTEADLPFTVRIAYNLHQKARSPRRREDSPFLPPEPALTVGAIPPRHCAVLNKFNVMDHHLLIVTRDYEDQEQLLTREDFEALAFGLAAIDGLAFYNGGPGAGASQPHKHLQIVPLESLAASDPGSARGDHRDPAGLPLEACFRALPPRLEPFRFAGFPFRHGLVRFLEDGPERTAEELETTFQRLIAYCGLPVVERDEGYWQGVPYNLVLTRHWMLLVPRQQERVAGVSLNSLAYVGSLFVKDHARLATVQAQGPLQLLRGAAFPEAAEPPSDQSS